MINLFYSKPGTFFFINRIQRAMRSTVEGVVVSTHRTQPSTSWMKRQNERLWCMVPFWDSVGVAMINSCKAKDLRIICRPGAVAKYLKKGVQVRVDKDGHSKVIVGDTAKRCRQSRHLFAWLF